MKAFSIVKAGLGGGAAILLAGFLAAAPAQASTGKTVPCKSAALIAAINTANSNGGGTINLAPGCTYPLTAANNSTGGGNGLPVITGRITLNGFRTTIAGNDTTFRIFLVSGSGNLTLQGLTITGGNTGGPGGGIFNDEGTLTLDHSTVTGNTTAMGGGGIASGTMGTGPVGTTTLNFSQVNGNTAADGASAGGILNHAGTLILNFSQVNGNTAAGGGGGIASGTGNGGAAGASILTLNASQVNGNTSLGGPTAGAGGIANGGTATLNASQVNDNTAPGAPGGGILNHGTMAITGSQVNGNTAPTDSSGDLGDGGGIANINLDLVLESEGVPSPPPSGVLTITASQVNGNSASQFGGGIADVGINTDGTPTAPAGALTLKLALVTGNTAGVDGGGLYTSPGSPVSLKASLIIKNTPDNCSPLGSIAGCKN
jgi:hypothetical protein